MFQSRDKKEAKSFLEKIGWSVSTLGESPEDYARAIRRAVKNYPEKSLKILSNSKEEKDNVKPFYTPGLSTKELKTRAEVERYMFEQRREVDKCISWMESTKKKIQEIEKEPKPHSIGWAERLRSAQSSYKQYKRWMEMHEEFAARAEDWLSKNRNSKDNEKDNDSQVIERGTIKGVEYFIEKITETVKYPRPFEQVRYVGKLKKDGRVVDYTPRHERLDVCKRAVEDLAQDYIHNSKEEKGYYAKLAEEKASRKN